MLEAGCGTGNYSLGFLKEGIGKLTMIDASQAFLSEAETKVSKYANNIIEIKQVFLPKLPYPDNSFDVVAFLQVLHHLDRDEDVLERKHPAIEEALRETYRVLKPNGVVLIDILFKEMTEINPISLAPKALEIWKKRYVDEDDLVDLLESSNFSNLHYLGRPNCTYFTKDHMFHRIEALIDPDLKSTISCLGLMESTGELEEVKQLIREKIADGTIKELKEKYNRKLRTNGLHTNVFAQKKITIES